MGVASRRRVCLPRAIIATIYRTGPPCYLSWTQANVP